MVEKRNHYLAGALGWHWAKGLKYNVIQSVSGKVVKKIGFLRVSSRMGDSATSEGEEISYALIMSVMEM